MLLAFPEWNVPACAVACAYITLSCHNRVLRGLFVALLVYYKTLTASSEAVLPIIASCSEGSKTSTMSILQLRAYKIAALVVLFTFAALYWHAEAHAGRLVPQNSFQDRSAPAVRVQFIGESLCPDCAAFTTDILDPVYRSDLKDVVDLDYIGWGNAKNTSGAPECQHGPRECKLNKALNCAQHYSR